MAGYGWQGPYSGFSEHVLVMTSNVGLDGHLRIGQQGSELLRRKEAMEAFCALRSGRSLSPDDEIVIFNSAREGQLKSIVGMLLKNVEKLLAERKITLVADAAAQELLRAKATIRHTARGLCGARFSGEFRIAGAADSGRQNPARRSRARGPRRAEGHDCGSSACRPKQPAAAARTQTKEREQRLKGKTFCSGLEI